MEETRRSFVPAAGRDWALPLYDPLVKCIGGDRARTELLEAAPPLPSHIVLDVGCGTGSLAMLIKRLHPAVEVVGLDPDPRALARASHKASEAALEVRLDRGFADALPYAPSSFDRVYSSFVYHHLGPEEKMAMLREAWRVLRPGGFLALLDFEGPEPDAGGTLSRWLRSRPVFADNGKTRLLTSMRQARFEDPKQVARGSVVFGLVSYTCLVGGVA
jgi:ubiquinone/menaquinone biosynthesis C-methylase UbiE